MVENQQDKLTLVLAGNKNWIDAIFGSNLGLAWRIAHPMHLLDDSRVQLMQIAQRMPGTLKSQPDDIHAKRVFGTHTPQEACDEN